MGCGTSKSGMKQSEKSMKAALLIQKWYRRYQARLEARRRCTWNIFQSIEYSGEQNQLKLYNFFDDMLTHLQMNPESNQQSNVASNMLSISTRPHENGSNSNAEEELLKNTDPSRVKVNAMYKGAKLTAPMTSEQLTWLIEAYRNKELLHAKYVLFVLHETRRMLKRRPNISYVSTAITKQITVCGDLHGKLDDLFIIFHKNGLPSPDNPYIFNGDFVDRGWQSVEVTILLFCCSLVYPNDVFLNRGNHEDHVMNLRYGFVKEIMSKYKEHATKIVRLFEDVFSWLPLATIIDNKILVAHGGVSDTTDLDYLKTIDRHRFLSCLRPPVDRTLAQMGGCREDDEEDDDADLHSINSQDRNDLCAWRQVLDLLWSDPKNQKGCTPNTFRGGGTYFGPDVTEAVLQKHRLDLLIRSHECKQDGYEYTHNDKVLTVFSASNYYEMGSNRGAYVKLGTDLKPHIVQYMATKDSANRKLTIQQRVSVVEESAIRDLKTKILASRHDLIDCYLTMDHNQTGKITVAEWCAGVEEVLQLELPWRTLRHKLVKCDEDGMIEYASAFDQFKIMHKFSEQDSASGITETLYRNKDSLETIFRIIDKDNSGVITNDEFEEACSLLSKHIGLQIPKEQARDLAKCIDINKDGQIDFNEFLEAFRLVDPHGKDLTVSHNQQNGSSGEIT
ncbi:unnamed protein product [Owenia fusiformis]|uniref:Serine/threonine-protein phosphatase with EF-hands n=1 Tax=Owenia fusiformis TaxID=6347 RepID=A0A8J1XL39_OWEFU|nr:unnamed protein product [Owenia fusiformis]